MFVYISISEILGSYKNNLFSAILIQLRENVRENTGFYMNITNFLRSFENTTEIVRFYKNFITFSVLCHFDSAHRNYQRKYWILQGHSHLFYPDRF